MSSTKVQISESLFGEHDRLMLEADRLHTFQSPHQLIRVYHHPVFGYILRLGDHIQTSVRDEHFYHEAMVQPIMFNDKPKNVLIVGGGDGGIAKQVLKHDGVLRVVIAELDESVVDISRQYLPEVSGGAFDDPRVQLHIGDGLLYAAQNPGQFDVIFLDLPDPEGEVAKLSDELAMCVFKNALTSSGTMVMHTGSIMYQREQVEATLERAKRHFKEVNDYSQYVPLYGSQWGFAMCRKSDFALQLSSMVGYQMGKKVDWGFKLYNEGYHAALLTTDPMAFWK